MTVAMSVSPILASFYDDPANSTELLASVRLLAEDDEVAFMAYQIPSILPSQVGDPAACLFTWSKNGVTGSSVCDTLLNITERGISGTVGIPNGSYSYTWGPIGAIEYSLEAQP